jgi:hypothetical protein
MCLSQFLNLPFFQNLVSTLIGSFTGVFLAFSLNRLVSWNRKRKQRKDLIQLLISGLKRNQQAIKRIYDEIVQYNDVGSYKKQTWFPTEHVNIFALQFAGFSRYGLIDDIDLNRKLDDIQYKLENLHLKVEIMLKVGIAPRVHDNIMDTIKTDSSIIMSDIDEILTIMGSEADK